MRPDTGSGWKKEDGKKDAGPVGQASFFGMMTGNHDGIKHLLVQNGQF